MRSKLNDGIRSLLLALGVKPDRVDYYRDIALVFPTLIGVVFAIAPLFDLIGNSPISTHDARKAVAGLAIAIVCSLISPNWGDVLGAAFAFLALRGLVTLLLVTRDALMLVSTIAFFAVAIVLHRVGGGSYG